MRWTRWTVALLSLGAIAAAVVCVSCATPTTNAGPPAATAMTLEQKVARGKQISFSSACIDCHTPGTLYGAPDTTRMLSGSELGWEGPWGVSYPRNLTPDNETGLGTWTEDQIVAAVRTGVRPDKTPILPPMPWPAYAYMSDDDAYALAAYLKSLPPISHKAPDRIPPGQPAKGARVTFPSPPAYDALNLPPPPASGQTSLNTK